MPLLFLAGFSQGNRRLRLQHNEGPTLRRIVFPRPAWLTRALSRHNGLHLLATDRVDHRIDNNIDCPLLVNVAAGCPYTGPLAPWSEEARYVWFIEGCPYGAFTLHLQSMVVVTPAPQAQTARQHRLRIWTPGHLMSIQGAKVNSTRQDGAVLPVVTSD